MNSRTILRQALLYSLVILLQPCGAQENSVELQFLTFPKAMDVLPVELVVAEGKTLEIKVPSNEISRTVIVPRMESWVFGITVMGEDGKPSFKPYGQAKAIAAPKQLILLIRKGNAMADGIEVRPIPNDVGNFDGGKFLFMNAAKVDIAGEAGGEKFALKPGGHTIVKPKSKGGSGLIHAMFYFRRDDQPRPFFSSKWPISDKTRGLIFFYHDPDTQRLRLHSIRHFLED